METTFQSLPTELFLIIVSNLTTLKDKLSARLATTDLHKAVSFMKIKQSYMTNKICHPTKGSGDHLSYLKVLKHKQYANCINADCIFESFADYSQPIGMTTFYYPKDLPAPHDYYGDPYGPNFEFPHRVGACKNSPTVTRFIPYCDECMAKHVNLGRREDGLDVPFSQGSFSLIRRHYQLGAGYGINNF